MGPRDWVSDQMMVGFLARNHMGKAESPLALGRKVVTGDCELSYGHRGRN